MARKAPMHPCAGCPTSVPVFLVACKDCFRLLPGWLRGALGAEAKVCKQSGVRHTQRLLELRHQADAFLRTKGEETPA